MGVKVDSAYLSSKGIDLNTTAIEEETGLVSFAPPRLVGEMKRSSCNHGLVVGLAPHYNRALPSADMAKDSYGQEFSLPRPSRVAEVTWIIVTFGYLSMEFLPSTDTSRPGGRLRLE